jgi:pimeloyl-ACP methyl ester carboxylesterase
MPTDGTVDGAGPALVLLHAFPLDSRMFDRIRRMLPGIELHTPDLPGFAGTELPRAEPDLGRYVDAVIAVLDRAGLNRAVVGGVSMGGYVTLRLLAEHPDRVAGAVLADTRSAADTAAAAAGRLSRAADAERDGLPAGAELVAPLLAPGATEGARTEAAALADAATPAAFAWAQRAMAARADTTAVLAGAGVPVLVIVGAEDGVTPPTEAAAVAAAVGDRATLVEIPGSGHLTPIETPADFAAAIRNWYRSAFE